MIKRSTPVCCTFCDVQRGWKEETLLLALTSQKEGLPICVFSYPVFEGLDEYKDPAEGIADQSETSCVQEF